MPIHGQKISKYYENATGHYGHSKCRATVILTVMKLTVTVGLRKYVATTSSGTLILAEIHVEEL